MVHGPHAQFASINNSSTVVQFMLNTTLTTTENTTSLHSNKVCKSLGRNIIYLKDAKFRCQNYIVAAQSCCAKAADVVQPDP